MSCPACTLEVPSAALFCPDCAVHIDFPDRWVRATVSKRAGALVIDAVLGNVLILGASALLGEAGGWGMQAAWMGAFVFFWLRGQTPGKALLGLRVLRRGTDRVPGLGRMVVRDLVGRFVSGIALGVGFISAIPDDENRTWHDKMVDTVVVEEPSSGHELP